MLLCCIKEVDSDAQFVCGDFERCDIDQGFKFKMIAISSNFKRIFILFRPPWQLCNFYTNF
jgi:hypothetical protein